MIILNHKHNQETQYTNARCWRSAKVGTRTQWCDHLTIFFDPSDMHLDPQEISQLGRKHVRVNRQQFLTITMDYTKFLACWDTRCGSCCDILFWDSCKLGGNS